MMQMDPDSINGFPKWLISAKKGDQFCYFQGKTPEDRDPCFIKPAKAQKARQVALVQKRSRLLKETQRGPVYEYYYIAQRR